MALSEAACDHGNIEDTVDIIREAGLKFAAIEMLSTLVSNYEVNKNVVSNFVMNALKFLFDSNSETGKNIQNLLHKQEPKR